MSVDVIKQELLSKLKQEHCFWSYNEDSIKDIPDDMLIEKTLLHLDLEEINQLFLVYPFKKIKQVWLDSVSYTHLRAHETDSYLVCRLLLEKKKKKHTHRKKQKNKRKKKKKQTK